MRLTSKGRDFLAAMVFIGGYGLATGELLFAALGASMGVTALLSLTALALARSKGLEVKTSAPRLRVFKGEVGQVEARLLIPNGWVTAAVDSAEMRGGQVSVRLVKEGVYSLSIFQSLAGRFRDCAVVVRLVDALGLFSMPRVRVELGTVVEVLPDAMAVREPVAVSLAVVGGEREGGRPGSGQEYFSAQEYTPQSEARDIMWKRAARSPEEPLMARVREMNVPSEVEIQVRRGKVDPAVGLKEADALCEVVGGLGSALLQARVRLDYSSGRTQLEVSDDEDLAEAVMDASEADVEEEQASRFAGDLMFLVEWGELRTRTQVGARIRRISIGQGEGGVGSAEAAAGAVREALMH